MIVWELVSAWVAFNCTLCLSQSSYIWNLTCGASAMIYSVCLVFMLRIYNTKCTVNDKRVSVFQSKSLINLCKCMQNSDFNSQNERRIYSCLFDRHRSYVFTLCIRLYIYIGIMRYIVATAWLSKPFDVVVGHVCFGGKSFNFDNYCGKRTKQNL